MAANAFLVRFCRTWPFSCEGACCSRSTQIGVCGCGSSTAVPLRCSFCLFQKRVQVSLLLCARHRDGGHDKGLFALGQREGHRAAAGAPAAEPQQPLLRLAQVGPWPVHTARSARQARSLPGGCVRIAPTASPAVAIMAHRSCPRLHVRIGYVWDAW